MAEGASVGEHMIKMLGYGTRLAALGFPIPEALGTDLVLASLPPVLRRFYHELQHEWDGQEPE
jgi:hypothetical protein